MTRLPPAQRDSLNERQGLLFDSIVESRSGGSFDVIGSNGGLVGPFNAMVTQPGTGEHWNALGARLRFDSTMDQRLVELAICTVGAHFRADFEFLAHAPLALSEGITSDVIEALRLGEAPDFVRVDEQLVYDVVTRLLRAERLSEEQFAQAKELLGLEALGELSGVIGYYCWIAVTLNFFEVAPPLGQESPWEM